MFRKTLLAISAAAVGLVATQASADDWFYRPNYGYRHAAVHDGLDHRAFHRELEHRDAHSFPMSWREHERLHDVLDHEAYHDGLEHRQFHQYNCSPSYGSYRYYRGNSVFFGNGRTQVFVGW